MILRVRNDPAQQCAVLIPDDASSASWIKVRSAVEASDPDYVYLGDAILTRWDRALAVLVEIYTARTVLGIDIRPEGEAEAIVRTHSQEMRAVRQQRLGNRSVLLDVQSFERILEENGFTGRKLRDFQKASATELLAMKNGADFSVPGAGKTTVALAVHAAWKAESRVNARLLVVAPKNAFGAWDETAVECFPASQSRRFVRLTGDSATIGGALNGESEFFLISYDKLSREAALIASHIATKPFHVILDESHRIKRGESGARGRAVASLATFPVRRDILSGTPAPNRLDDIVPQLEFLWPGQTIWNSDAARGGPRALRPFFVRVTKRQLGLPKVTRHFVPIEMSAGQKALYCLLRDQTLREFKAFDRKTITDLRKASRCVMRLLQTVTNPREAVVGMFDGFSPDSPECRDVYEAVLAEGDSPKMERAVHLARSFAAEGSKCVIWAAFHANINRLESRLRDLKPVCIHGKVGTGDVDDDDSREHRLRQFHDDPACMVLIGNPAACAEGISVHTVCHRAIYLERTYNAAHYLQSIDRIHRLGLSPETKTDIYVLQSIGSLRTGSIDYSVSRRLKAKIQQLEEILADTDLRELSLDEEASEALIDDISLADFDDLLRQLREQGCSEDDLA